MLAFYRKKKSLELLIWSLVIKFQKAGLCASYYFVMINITLHFMIIKLCWSWICVWYLSLTSAALYLFNVGSGIWHITRLASAVAKFSKIIQLRPLATTSARLFISKNNKQNIFTQEFSMTFTQVFSDDCHSIYILEACHSKCYNSI